MYMYIRSTSLMHSSWLVYTYIYIWWCGNSQSYKTLSKKSSECRKYTVYKVYGTRKRVVKIGQNVQQLAQCFHTPACIMFCIAWSITINICALWTLWNKDSVTSVSPRCLNTLCIQTLYIHAKYGSPGVSSSWGAAGSRTQTNFFPNQPSWMGWVNDTTYV